MDIEQLMTRLDGMMPYDRRHGAETELALWLTKLKTSFVKRIREARDETAPEDGLAGLAECCVENSINCVTFNYDDVLDEALWKVRPVDSDIGFPYWHPDGGYGFFCKPSTDTVEDSQSHMDVTSMRLFKLHGSVNWHARLGSSKPYSLRAIVHDEPWFKPLMLKPSLIPLIPRHLDPEPFIVPPVLVKSSLVEEPILQFLWSVAYEELEQAERVIFVGYSFPVTDMAARFLFTETLIREKDRPEIRVVNKASTDEEKETVRQAYRTVFPRITNEQFEFGGACEWSREFVANVSAEKAESG
jgi:hypothetical protein